MPVRVLIVDDSPAIRAFLKSRLRTDPSIQIVGEAGDAYEARELIAKTKPSVLTLDIEMPRMSGLEFLQRLMRHHPLPVVVISTLAGPGTESAVRALELGAVAAISKEQAKVPGRLVNEILNASRAAPSRAGSSMKTIARVGTPGEARVNVIAIASSTGGPRALNRLFTQLPAGLPPIVIAQHMPPRFTAALAERLDKLGPIKVTEAKNAEALQPGQAVIAPGGVHLEVRGRGARLITRLSDAPPEHHQRPSCDVLFRSVARATGASTTAVILTGMGADGAEGLLQLKQAGAHTIAQDEASSMVFGMPREAIARGAAKQVLPLDGIAEAIVAASTVTDAQTGHRPAASG